MKDYDELSHLPAPGLEALLLGYVAGLAESLKENPYCYLTDQALRFEQGREIGGARRNFFFVRARTAFRTSSTRFKN